MDKTISDDAAKDSEKQTKSKKWWLEPSVIISLSAFILSVSTAFYQNMRENTVFYNNLTAQLRSSINNFSEIGMKGIEAHEKYKDNHQALLAYSIWLGAQNNNNALQVTKLIADLGERVEAHDLIMAENGLRSAGFIKDSKRLLDLAKTKAKEIPEIILVNRTLSQYYFMQRKFQESKDAFISVVKFIESNAGYENNQYMLAEYSYTLETRAGFVGNHDCNESKENMMKAIQLAEKAQLPPFRMDQLKNSRERLLQSCP